MTVFDSELRSSSRSFMLCHASSSVFHLSIYSATSLLNDVSLAGLETEGPKVCAGLEHKVGSVYCSYGFTVKPLLTPHHCSSHTKLQISPFTSLSTGEGASARLTWPLFMICWFSVLSVWTLGRRLSHSVWFEVVFVCLSASFQEVCSESACRQHSPQYVSQ